MSKFEYWFLLSFIIIALYEIIFDKVKFELEKFTRFYSIAFCHVITLLVLLANGIISYTIAFGMT